jgi:chemotaxis-related protein WspD
VRNACLSVQSERAAVAASMDTASNSALESTATAVDACWSRIGVSGDRSCAQLEQHVHCRNCPVQSAAARSLLERPAPEDYRRDWTVHFAQPTPSLDSPMSSVVIFRLGPERFALPTKSCLEVSTARQIHSLPLRSDGVLLGVASVRGELVVCVSLSALLSVATPGHTDSADPVSAPKRLLVMGCPEGPIAFLADEVLSVYRHRVEDSKPPPATVAQARVRFTKGVLTWNGHTVGILDDESLRRAINRRIA